ncbi:hypothetical protein BH10ACI2_BH10ACI2_11020 [soil metagenome]
MRFLFSLLVVFFLISVASGQMSSVSLPIDDKFSLDAQVEYTKGPIPRGYVVGKRNGVEYRYYLDDVSGTVEGTKGGGTGARMGAYDPKSWGFHCQKSEKSGQKFCHFFREGIAIFTYTPDRSPVTLIARTNFSLDDGKLDTFADVVQVDDDEIYNSRNKQFSSDALSLMGAGKTLTLHRGPAPGSVTAYSLYGFTEALELSEWAVKRIQ